ncbi:hypothetical protein RFI_16658, partial [Reticulomyxa filosa]
EEEEEEEEEEPKGRIKDNEEVNNSNNTDNDTDNERELNPVSMPIIQESKGDNERDERMPSKGNEDVELAGSRAKMSEAFKRYFIALFYYARCLRKNGQYTDSEVCWLKLLQMWPDHYGVHVEYGLCLSEMDRYKEAQEHYLTAITINEQDHTAYRHFGTLRFMAGQYVHALALWDRCFELMTCAGGTLCCCCCCTRKDFSVLLARYAWCIDQIQKNAELARQYYEFALSFDPNNVFAMKYLGILIHTEYKDSEKALEYLGIVIHLESQSALAVAWYADALRCAKNVAVINRLKQVELYWNKALRLQPDLIDNIKPLQLAHEAFQEELRAYPTEKCVTK